MAPRAAFYAMPQVTLPPGVTDEDYVLGLLRATGMLCVYGSGFGTRPGDGFFRIVFLASLEELAGIYDDIGALHAPTFLAEPAVERQRVIRSPRSKSLNLWTISMASSVVILWCAYSFATSCS